MAASLTISHRYVQGNRYVRSGTGNLGTYATGGVTVTKAALDLPVRVTHFYVGEAGGYVFEVSALADASATVKAYRQKDPAAAGGADIALPEVANAVDLSAVTFRWRAEGN